MNYLFGNCELMWSIPEYFVLENTVFGVIQNASKRASTLCFVELLYI